MEPADIILYIGLIIFISHLFTSFFESTRIPDVLLLIILGILLNLLGFDPTPFFISADILFEIALALILFEAGIHLKFNYLYSAIKSSTLLILGTYCFTILAVLFFCQYILMQTFHSSLILGFIMASISPAVVIPISRSMNISDRMKSNLIVESTMTDVLSIFFVIALVGYGTNYNNIHITTFLKDFSIVFIKSAGIGMLAAILWSYIFDVIRNLPNTIFTSLAFIFILFGVAHYIHTSAPITVLFFSMIISIPSNSKVRKVAKKFNLTLIEFTQSEKGFYEEILFIIKTFFFVFLGMKMSYLENIAPLTVVLFYIKAIGITLVIFFVRFLCIKITKPKISKNKSIVLLAMVPKGLAAAVLISFYANNVNIDIEKSQDLIFTTYGVILLSIFVSSSLVFIVEKKIKKEKLDGISNESSLNASMNTNQVDKKYKEDINNENF
tara:strand:+ start:2546 stop:3868 length:1323 start_codon:yes stop_codon:yes gene_type:complete